MYVKGVSTRNVKRITEELCGHSFQASTISNIVKRLDGKLAAFSERRLEEPFPYLILDARYERVRDGGVIASRAVLIALGVDWDGRRQVLAVELANRESRYPKLTAWVEDTIEETFAFWSLPLQHHKHLKSTNMLERVNQEIKRRTHIVRVFPNAPSCLRLVKALHTTVCHDEIAENSGHNSSPWPGARSYGFGTLGGIGVLTPNGAVTIGQRSSRSYRWGGQLEMGSGNALSVEAERRETDNLEPENVIMLRGVLRFHRTMPFPGVGLWLDADLLRQPVLGTRIVAARSRWPQD